jgi:diguanylate cyclase (GGDEF)-like protein
MAHAVRATMYAVHHDAHVTLFDASIVNLVCFALGTLALPGLTLGAVITGRPLSVLIFDVDHFKAINDTHGHAVGDRVLADLVARTGTVLRGDACARLGGEEFAVLLPHADADAAVQLAEDLRQTLERAAATGAGGAVVRYTVSVGVSSFDDGESFASLLQRADAALYAAKRGGRNRAANAQRAESVGARTMRVFLAS